MFYPIYVKDYWVELRCYYFLKREFTWRTLEVNWSNLSRLSMIKVEQAAMAGESNTLSFANA